MMKGPTDDFMVVIKGTPYRASDLHHMAQCYEPLRAALEVMVDAQRLGFSMHPVLREEFDASEVAIEALKKADRR